MSIPSLWKETKESALRGAPPKFKTPEELLEACCGYFEWIEQNSLEEEVLVSYQGLTTHETKHHPSAMLLSSLCLYIGVDPSTWSGWRKTRPDLSSVMQWAEDVIYDQKFRGAAGGMFSPNIIARDLGLADRSELTGKNGGPIEALTIDPSKLSTEVLEAILEAKIDAEPDTD